MVIQDAGVINTEEKEELQRIYESRFQKKVLEFLNNGYEQFINKRLYPHCIFTANKIVEINSIPAYYLHIEASPPLSEFHEYKFQGFAQFRRTTECGETFNIQLLDVVDHAQVEKFFTEIWQLMRCANYR
ncbi:MAG: hypothetical protein HWQ36_26155 [Nostoc sp. NMS2]|uniref:hypothetical protein n=1 Tax=Nostoc sp. NMS2 TaxID=2815389 RepID=UPI0025FC63DA|nr:hypothetical protein [Nostoc sp. NMS2]MBN3993871.1 hypothetical protein [Nostoc sp. NMS2]